MSRVLILIVLAVLLSGCGNLTSIHRPLNTESGQGVLIDIKQRAILVGSKKGQGGVRKKVVCAEPSPDSISSYLASLDASFSLTGKKDADLGTKVAENAAFIGLRTQSIQLLRDSYYRLCEAYMNDAITAKDYDIHMRRYQRQMVALLSIEALTGTLSVPAVTLNQSDNLIAQAVTDAEKSINALSEDIKALEAKESKEPDDISKLAELKEERKTRFGIQEKLASALKKPSTTATTPDSVEASAAQREEVSKVVGDLVKKVLDTDHYGQLCWSALRKHNGVANDIRQACKEFLDIKNKALRDGHELNTKFIAANISALNKAKSTDEFLRILEGLKNATKTAVGTPSSGGLAIESFTGSDDILFAR